MAAFADSPDSPGSPGSPDRRCRANEFPFLERRWALDSGPLSRWNICRLSCVLLALFSLSSSYTVQSGMMPMSILFLWNLNSYTGYSKIIIGPLSGCFLEEASRG